MKWLLDLADTLGDTPEKSPVVVGLGTPPWAACARATEVAGGRWGSTFVCPGPHPRLCVWHVSRPSVAVRGLPLQSRGVF